MPPRILHFVLALIVAIVPFGSTHEPPVVAAQASTGAYLASSPAGLSREVFGFALSGSLADPTYGYPSWNFSLLSTVAFFGLHVDGNGAIVSDSDLTVWNSSALTGLLSTAHSHGRRVVLTIVLQDFSPGNPSMCSGLAHRAVTVQQAVAQVTAKGVDGINVDYEGLNGSCPNGQTTRAMMTDFVRQLRTALSAGSYLSVDTYASSAADSLGFFDVSGLNSYVDAFFVMAYDLEYSNYRYSPPGCNSFCLGPTAPLTGYHYNDTSTAQQYMAVVPASKVILGVPYYGRKACVGAGNANAYPTGGVTADSYLDASGESGASGVTSFATHRDAYDPSGHERWDTWFNSSIGCTRELYWDDAVSLGAKYDLVNADNLGGVGIWTLNYGGGASELWSALSARFAACRAVSASPTGSAAVGTAVSISAAASGCPHAGPLYEFWILAPNATAWRLAQPYSTSAVLQWNTAGAAPGTYRVGVWARDAGSGGAYGNALGTWDASTVLTYTLVSIPCTGAAVSVTPSTPTYAGSTVVVTATAGGCPKPSYEFWLRAPGAVSWTMVQGYSASPDLHWNTTGAAAGTYLVEAWVRDASSSSAWDAYAQMQRLVQAPCSSVTASGSPGLSTTVGSLVTLSATAAGCSDPQYEFWLQPPGSSTWIQVQGYSSGSTMQWNTTGARPGIYQIAVWLRDANSAGLYGNSAGRWDASSAAPYTLVVQPCSGVTLTMSPAVSAHLGTVVTAAAVAAGCPKPLYEFWILPPRATTWKLAQAYSPSATLNWNTSGAPTGAYRIAVWARDSSSAGASGNSSGRWDTYGSAAYGVS